MFYVFTAMIWGDCGFKTKNLVPFHRRQSALPALLTKFLGRNIILEATGNDSSSRPKYSYMPEPRDVNIALFKYKLTKPEFEVRRLGLAPRVQCGLKCLP